MNSGWRVEGRGLARSWSIPREWSPHRPAWLEEPSLAAADNPAPPLPDFAAHSPLGSGEWIAPWHARWSVIARSWS